MAKQVSGGELRFELSARRPQCVVEARVPVLHFPRRPCPNEDEFFDVQVCGVAESLCRLCSLHARRLNRHHRLNYL